MKTDDGQEKWRRVTLVALRVVLWSIVAAVGAWLGLLVYRIPDEAVPAVMAVSGIAAGVLAVAGLVTIGLRRRRARNGSEGPEEDVA